MATAKKSAPERLTPAEENRIKAAQALARSQEKSDEADKTDSEPDTSSDVAEGVATPADQPDGTEATSEEVVVEAPKRSVSDRIRDIETRWGKDIQEVLIDVHDHVFGTSKPHDEK